MVSIRNAAQNVLDEARDGIAWILFWKAGRGWDSMAIWPDYDKDQFTFEADDLADLKTALAADPDAILVNSYYRNLGDAEEMTRDSLADALRWQYGLQTSRAADAAVTK